MFTTSLSSLTCHFILRDADAPATCIEDSSNDREINRLQEKSSTLKKFVSLMEEGLKSASKDVSKIQDVVKNQLEFQYQFTNVPEFLAYLSTPEGREFESRPMYNTVMALARAMLLISKPSVVQAAGSEGRAATEAIVNEIQKSMNDMYSKIGEARLKTTPVHNSFFLSMLHSSGCIRAVVYMYLICLHFSQ